MLIGVIALLKIATQLFNPLTRNLMRKWVKKTVFATFLITLKKYI
jgi:hypothetical protein